MPDGALRILSVAVLVLLYLFFVRTLRAMWVVSRPPEAQPTRTAPRRRSARAERTRKPPALVITDPEGRRGERFALSDENTIGRAPGCEISLEDGFVSHLHARVFASGGGFLVEDLGSTNGTRLNGEPVGSPTPVARGDRLRVGSFELEMDG